MPPVAGTCAGGAGVGGWLDGAGAGVLAPRASALSEPARTSRPTRVCKSRLTDGIHIELERMIISWCLIDQDGLDGAHELSYWLETIGRY